VIRLVGISNVWSTQNPDLLWYSVSRRPREEISFFRENISPPPALPGSDFLL
jgi:hypothetical protein